MAASKKNTKKKNTGKERHSLPVEIKILIGAAAAVILELSDFGILGKAGGWLGAFQFGLFGFMAYFFPVMLAAAIVLYGLSSSGKAAKLVCTICTFLFTGAIIHQATGSGYDEVTLAAYYKTGYETLKGGGLICGSIGKGLCAAFGDAGVYIISGLVIAVCILVVIVFHVLALRSENPPGKKPSSGAAKAASEERKASARLSYPEENVKKAKGMRSRYKEQEVYRTDEEGTVIRIVNAQPKNRIKRAQMTRSEHKASSVRGETAQKRSGAKVKGIASDLEIEKSAADRDDVHEITNAKPEKKQAKTAAAAAENTIKIRDASQAAKPVRIKEAAPAAKPRSPAVRIYEPAPAAKKPVPVREAGKGGNEDFSLPPLGLLGKKKVRAANAGEDVENTAKNLEYILDQFGVTARVVNIQTGPSVTRYELQPEMGTKVSKFTSLADDLRLNLAVAEIRIEAPVPGKNVVGIEIPNKSTQPVTLRELLEAPELANHSSKLAFAAGRNISGEVVIGDIAAMPHLLIAGTTGSGKSVFTKSIIMEILYRTRPDEVGLIVIDPKKVEFNVFEGIPHLMKSVVTDPGQAVSTLRWAVNEMMIRYDRMNKNGVNNIKSYNTKLERGRISDAEENPQKMPQIVIVIDELADLMMAAKKEVESYICRLAQLSRAAGIHMVIATQRPSADVVTGLIKSNIPSRVALKVASGIDSRVILDTMGAEKLLGKGDMLFYPNGFTAPVRVQGAFVTDKEVSDTVRYLIDHSTDRPYENTEKEIDDFISSSSGYTEAADTKENIPENRYDEYFREAGLLCIEMGRASSSMLQRRFNLGFNRAARIIDQLEEFGVIGPANGSKPREILVDSMTFEEMYSEMVK